MKKFIFVLILSCFFIPNIYAENINTKQISKKDWEEFQQYKKEQADKISISDDEYEQYQQYLKEQENKQEEKATVENKENLVKEKNNKVHENEIIIMGGKILNNSIKAKIKSSLYGTSVTRTSSNSDGWVARISFIHYLIDNTGIGLRESYASTFESNDISFLNSDVLLKQRFPMKFREKTYLYLVGGLGYGFLCGKTKGYDSEGYYEKLSGGLHWSISFGIDLTPFVIDLTYSCNYIDITTDHPYGITADESFCSFILSVGYKFNI